MKHLLFAAFALAAVPGLSFADDAPPAGPAVDSLSPPTCKKPVFHTKMRQADDDGTDEKSEAYTTCMKDYISAQSELADKHTKAANAAISDLNDFIKVANDRAQDAHNQK